MQSIMTSSQGDAEPECEEVCETSSAVDTEKPMDGTKRPPKVSTGIATPVPNACPSPVLTLECDYDSNPTELYQAIESRQWEYAKNFMRESEEGEKQAATWVIRKETNGKLRWRLLPLHAAIIFQSPAEIVEKLLQACPEAAQAKDDQGMLPIHLAFRTKHTCWETVEELLTAHPNAIFVKDRKGRAPLQCGLAAAAAAAASASSSSYGYPGLSSNSSIISTFAPVGSIRTTAENGTLSPAAHKAIFSVLELYTQISLSDQMQKALATSRATMESRIGAVQDSHVQTLTQLKGDWERQRNELSKKIQGYKKEIENMRSEFSLQQEMLEEKVRTEVELVDKLQQVTLALEAKTVIEDVTEENVATNFQDKEMYAALQREEKLKKTNKELLNLLETLLDQHASLKHSMDKLAWESSESNKAREELWDQYRKSAQLESEATAEHAEVWQQRLDQTNFEVSKKLNQILNQSQTLAENHDGEEKKEGEDEVDNGIEIAPET